jgi:hypothetical protein
VNTLLMPYAAGDPETKSRLTAFRQALERLGWSEDRNVRIDYRFAAGSSDRYLPLARELMALQPDVIVAVTTPVATTLQRETQAIPIVFTSVSDPIGGGFVASLARPGGNFSGVLLYEDGIMGKWLAMLKEIAPRLTRAANLFRADLSTANLSGATLHEANLRQADLNRADLSGADLRSAILVSADLMCADLTGCRIHGVSAWNLKLDGAKQQNLVITREGESAITVDDIEIAQFVYLLLHNEKIRDVIDTIGKKAVLILGRFTPKRKEVLDALREELRKRGYVPILFDFDKPASQDLTATVSTLAHLARFIIADLTEPSSIPKELEAIVPHLAVPVQPLLEGASRPYAMFTDYWKYDWVLPICWYEGLKPLLATLAKKVIAPAERKVKALEKRRRKIEAELTKPQ